MRYTSEENVLKLLELLDRDIAGVKVEIGRTPGSEKRYWEGAKYGYDQARLLIVSVLDFEEGVKCD